MGFGKNVAKVEKINKYVLGSDNKGKAFWLVAAKNGYLESLQKFGPGLERN